jgi:5-methylcytosine-specific restriction endonuclease McrA
VPSFRDITGQTFGLWTAVERAPNLGRATAWTCRCSCGNRVAVQAGNLFSGKSKSCGCALVPDLTGQRFAKLTVLSRAPNREDGKTRWNCRCDCGSELVVRRKHLVAGGVSSCGCLRSPDLSGRVFGRWTVLAKANDRGNARWACACACGDLGVVSSDSLLKGDSESCGCLQREIVTKRATKHGLCGTAEYRSIHAHKRRAAKTAAGGSFTAAQLRALYASQCGSCTYCLLWLPFESMEADHILPVSRGGSSWIENIQMLCVSCNRRKHNKTHDEFLAYKARRAA